MVYGFYGGLGIYSLGDTTVTDDISGNTVNVSGGTIPTVEAGFGMAGRFNLIAAGAFDPVHSQWGGRLRMRVVFGGGSLAFHLGMNCFGLAGSTKDGMPIFQTTMDVGLGDGPAVF
jgi:hypothetical protein